MSDSEEIITLSEPYHDLLSLVFGIAWGEWERTRLHCKSFTGKTQLEFAQYLLSLHSSVCKTCLDIKQDPGLVSEGSHEQTAEQTGNQDFKDSPLTHDSLTQPELSAVDCNTTTAAAIVSQSLTSEQQEKEYSTSHEQNADKLSLICPSKLLLDEMSNISIPNVTGSNIVEDVTSAATKAVDSDNVDDARGTSEQILKEELDETVQNAVVNNVASTVATSTTEITLEPRLEHATDLSVNDLLDVQVKQEELDEVGESDQLTLCGENGETIVVKAVVGPDGEICYTTELTDESQQLVDEDTDGTYLDPVTGAYIDASQPMTVDETASDLVEDSYVDTQTVLTNSDGIRYVYVEPTVCEGKCICGKCGTITEAALEDVFKAAELDTTTSVHTQAQLQSTGIVKPRKYKKRKDCEINSNNNKTKTPLPRIFTCHVCGKSFQSGANLRRHIMIHTGEKPYQCSVCHNYFREESALKNHMRKHTGEKPYMCDTCGKRFPYVESLTVHRRIHTGERPYKCKVCEATFTQLGSLNTHMEKHNKERPFQCEFCTKRFSYKTACIDHQRLHTGEKPFTCDDCGMSFRRKEMLRQHELTHSGERPYKCQYCNRSYTRKAHLQRHEQSHRQAIDLDNLQVKSLLNKQSLMDEDTDAGRVVLALNEEHSSV